MARRTRSTVRHVDPLSVLKVSLFYYSVLLLMGLIVVAIFYALAQVMGVVDLIEQLGQGFAVNEADNFKVGLGLVEKWAFFIGLVFMIVASVVNVVVAILYNIGADIFGGVEVTFIERDL